MAGPKTNGDLIVEAMRRRAAETARRKAEKAAGVPQSPDMDMYSDIDPANMLMDYGNSVADAWNQQGARASKGMHNIADGKGEIDDVLDAGFGTVNAAMSPLAPPIGGLIEKGVEHTGTGGFFQGWHDNISKPLSDASNLLAFKLSGNPTGGISPENYDETAMWTVPVAGEMGVRAGLRTGGKLARVMADKFNEGSAAYHGDMLPPIDPNGGWELTPEEAVQRWDSIRADSGQTKFPETAPTLAEHFDSLPVEQQIDPLNINGEYGDPIYAQAAQKGADHISASDLEPIAPEGEATPAKKAALSTMRRSGERRVGKTVWKNPSNYGQPTGYEKSEILHNPTAKQVEALKKKAPYGELRWLGDTTTGDVHVWPAAHGFHNDASKAMGLGYLDSAGQMIHGYFDDSYPVSFGKDVKTIDDLLDQQWGGRNFIEGADRTIGMAGGKRPHAPGAVNPKARTERLAAEPNRAPTGAPGSQIMEQLPGYYDYRMPQQGHMADPRNKLANDVKDNGFENTRGWDYKETTPGRYMPRNDFAEMQGEASRSSPPARVGREIGPDDQMQAGALDFNDPAKPDFASNDAPMSLDRMKREWEDNPGIWPQFSSDNAATHNIETGTDYYNYVRALEGDGKNVNWKGDTLPDMDLARARGGRMMDRAKDRLFKGEDLPDDKQFWDDNGGRDGAALSPNDLARLIAERPDMAGLEMPTKGWLKDNDWYQSPLQGEGHSDPIFRPLRAADGEEPYAYTSMTPNALPEFKADATRFGQEKKAAGSIGEGVAKALMKREDTRTGDQLYGNRKPLRGGSDKPLVSFDGKGKPIYREAQQRAGERITADDLNIDGNPIHDLGPEPHDVALERGKLATGSTVFKDPTMYGEPTGVPQTTILHNPNLRQIKRLQKTAPYGEVRYLTDENGDTHFWPAYDAYHNDVAQFLGVPDDYAIHGHLNAKDFERAMSYHPDNVQQFVLADQRSPSTARKRVPDYDVPGVENHQDKYNYEDWWNYNGQALPLWQWERERFDRTIPGRRVGEAMDNAGGALRDQQSKQAAQAAQATPEAAEPAAPAEPRRLSEDPTYDALKKPWLRQNYTGPRAISRALSGEAAGPTGIKGARVRVGNEPTERRAPLIGKNGSYREAQSKIGDEPVTAESIGLDKGVDAVGSFDGNKDWSKAPVTEVHAAQRAALMDKNRPIPTEADAPAKMNLRAAKKELTAPEAEAKLAERREVLGKVNDEKVVKSSTLASSITKSVDEHIAMSPAERAINLKAAEETLSRAMGNKNGQVTRLFTKNAKLLKAEKGYEGNWVKEPMKLPNKQGIETTGMALAPSSETRGFKTCPNSASCRDSCLGFKAGQYYQGGEHGGPQTASRKRTQALLDHPEAYGVVMHEEIAAARRTAIKNGNILGVRLNVLSDVDPKVYASLIKAFPDVWFYDYTKMNYRPIAKNHHVTYSSTGVSNAEVTNLNQNWGRMRAKLEGGDNVAMAFTDKKSIPKFVMDEETGRMYRTVDGVGTDFRPSDLMETDGKEGVIVALKNMDQSTHKGESHKETAGFLVPYDAKYKKEISAKGKEGKYVRDERGSMVPTSEIAVIPRQVSRKTERESARVKITVGGKDKSDYGGQSTGYTPDQNAAPAAGMKNITGEAKQSFPLSASEAYDASNQSHYGPGMMRENTVGLVKDHFGTAGKPLKDRTPEDWGPRKGDTSKRRPFSADYPGMPEDGAPLSKTRRGTPLEAKNVIGRRTAGGSDQPLTNSQIADITRYLLRDSDRHPDMGQGAKRVLRTPNQNLADMGGIIVTTTPHGNPVTGMGPGDTAIGRIRLNSRLPREGQDNVLRHEVGHGLATEYRRGKNDPIMRGANRRFGTISDQAFTMPTMPPEIESQMRRVFHDSNTYSSHIPAYDEKAGAYGNLSPENHGYNSNHNPHELLAEFFATASRDPDYVKTVAPEAYEWMAEQLDADPKLRKVVQMNSVGGGLAAMLAAKMMEGQEQQQ